MKFGLQQVSGTVGEWILLGPSLDCTSLMDIVRPSDPSKPPPPGHTSSGGSPHVVFSGCAESLRAEVTKVNDLYLSKIKVGASEIRAHHGNRIPDK